VPYSVFCIVMASFQATADSIRAAVSSISTCTPATATLLSDLLLPKTDVQHVTSTSNPINPTKPIVSSKSKPTKPAARSRNQKVVCEDKPGKVGNQLSPKERLILATEIINTTLKALSDAIKAPAPEPVRRQGSSKDLVKASARKALRRSNSLPQSPLQPRSLNRVSSSPSLSSRESRSSSSASITSSGHRSIAECARIAFSCLRTLQASKISGIDFPDLQLENGMSALIGKLVSLGLDDLAIKELRVLKRRLDSGEGSKKSSASKGAVTANAQPLPDMLDFGKAQFTGAKLGLVITTQLQILRLITSSRKPKHAEAALPLLVTTHPSSPTRLLLLAAKESIELKQAEKLSHQLQNLSEIQLSLTPSVSPADDALAVEPRLSVTPDVAVQLQTLALHNRFLWWGIAGHKGDLSKEIFDPFLRCLSSFARRSQTNAPEKYRLSASVTTDLMTLLNDCSDSQPRGLKSILGGIYKVLGSFAKDANLISEAITWTEEYQKTLDHNVDSDAKRCSVIARLVSLKLRMTAMDPKDEGLLLTLLEELECPFKGESSEIDELLTEVSQARRSAMTVLSQYKGAPGPHAASKLPHGLRQMCESLVFLCPRLSIRYLGNPPNVTSATKDIVRHEQRRYFISKPALNSIDSVLFLVRALLGEGRMAWDLVDSKLQDCILLLNRLELNLDNASTYEGSSPSSYHVRISNLYYTLYLDMRRDSENTKDSQQLRILRRSIDSIRGRPRHERKAALISTKLERMAEFCKMTGRYDELSKTLSCLRDEMIGDGSLIAIADLAASRPIKVTWNEHAEATVLGRTIQSLLKVQIKYASSISEISLFEPSWSEEEIAAVLELQLDTLSKQASDSATAHSLISKAFRELLSVYDRTRFPIRRIRVLLRLWPLDIQGLEDIMEEMFTELSPTSMMELTVEGTRDERLAGYFKHLRAMATTTAELQREKPRVDVLKEGLGVWSSIRKLCEDIASLERQVDDVPGLITHLHTIGDYLDMKGFATARVAVLRLIAEIDELYSDKSSPDDLVLGFTRLGVQWLQLGYSGKAGLALDRARIYNQQIGVTAFASLQLQISYSHYLLAIGSLDKM
jgi:separase